MNSLVDEIERLSVEFPEGNGAQLSARGGRCPKVDHDLVARPSSAASR